MFPIYCDVYDTASSVNSTVKLEFDGIGLLIASGAIKRKPEFLLLKPYPTPKYSSKSFSETTVFLVGIHLEMYLSIERVKIVYAASS